MKDVIFERKKLLKQETLHGIARIKENLKLKILQIESDEKPKISLSETNATKPEI